MTERAITPFAGRQTMIEPPVFDVITATPVPYSTLLHLLSLRRPDRSAGEAVLIDQYLLPLAPAVDEYGNLFVTVGTEAPSVAFTAHTDTVHRDEMHNAGHVFQALEFHFNGHVVGVEAGNCLGADDGTGVWVLLNMIQAGVQGLYCFFRAEESGRLGSEWSAANNAPRYDGIDIMISFDRAGSSDIITHQMGQRCCSESFAMALGTALDPSGGLTPDPTGSFTDSYSFLDIIPECTNVSVGYDAQHSSFETQDLTWASWLVMRLIQTEFALLPIVREPAVDEPIRYTMAELVEAYPEAIADLLETFYGVTPQEVTRDLEDYYGMRPGEIAGEMDRHQAPSYHDRPGFYFDRDYEDDRDAPYCGA